MEETFACVLSAVQSSLVLSKSLVNASLGRTERAEMKDLAKREALTPLKNNSENTPTNSAISRRN